MHQGVHNCHFLPGSGLPSGAFIFFTGNWIAIQHYSSIINLSMDVSRLTQDRTTEPVSRDQILRRERGQGNIHLPCLADHEQDWQHYPVDPYSCYMC